MSNKSKNRTLWQIAGFKSQFLLVIACTLPGIVISLFLLGLAEFDWLETITILFVLFVPWLLLLSLFFIRGIRPWQSVANILMSFREKDFSLRVSTNQSDDVINRVLVELNLISEYLSNKRVDAYEAQKLLSKILVEVELAVFLFNHKKELVMANQYAANLYNSSINELQGKTIEELNLSFIQLAAHTSVQQHNFPAKNSRWLVKQSCYRQQGLAHQMILVADIAADLRKEEMQAWQKLIRTLSHEINNALTPLKTTVGTMRRSINKTELMPDWQSDFRESLQIIDNRIDNLNRLVTSYSQLARLPQPNKQLTSLSQLWNGLKKAYQLPNLTFEPLAKDIELKIDSAQIEQALVNLIKNALEASAPHSEQSNQVNISCQITEQELTFVIIDSGAGLQNPDNLFVPYFTTKPQGSGIGLVLSRQIAELHGGTIQLQNRESAQGCEATLALPLN